MNGSRPGAEMAWKSVSIVVSASPQRIWQVYSQLTWQDWDLDIRTMSAASGIREGAAAHITMKDGKTHVATFKSVSENERFSYTAPLPGGALLQATHSLEQLGTGTTRVTHTFDIDGGVLIGRLYRWLTRDYVQHGLDTNTAALKELVERTITTLP